MEAMASVLHDQDVDDYFRHSMTALAHSRTYGAVAQSFRINDMFSLDCQKVFLKGTNQLAHEWHHAYRP